MAQSASEAGSRRGTQVATGAPVDASLAPGRCLVQPAAGADHSPDDLTDSSGESTVAYRRADGAAARRFQRLGGHAQTNPCGPLHGLLTPTKCTCAAMDPA